MIHNLILCLLFSVSTLSDTEHSSKMAQNLVLEAAQVAGVELSQQELSEILLRPEESEPSLTILAFGDMMLSRHVRVLMDTNGQDYIFEGLDLSALQEGTDVVHANLEGPIHGKGTKGGTSLVFSFNRDVAPLLKKHGFNLLSISNNHALDQGWEARDETIQVLEENDLDWCGHPSQADPDSVHYNKTESGLTYAFVCFQDITHTLDLNSAKKLIQKIDPNVDAVIASVHWGYEYQHTNNERQKELAYGFVGSGADFVIGHHPHVVQNFEVYNGVPIFYSLGNFVFDQYWSQATQEELAIKIKMTKDRYEIELIPMKSERAQSRLMNEEEKTVWINAFLNYGEYDEAMQKMIKELSLTLER